MNNDSGLPACPVCSGSSAPCFEASEHRMYRCTSCHIAFVYPIPSKEYLTRFYSRYHQNHESEKGYGEFESRADADFPAKIAMVQSMFRKDQFRLLDVGCGRGFFVKACIDSGINAIGVDLSDSAVKHAVEELKVKALQGRLTDLVDTIGEFDVVTLWATIEHVPNPVELLRSIYRVLKPGGTLFLDTGIGSDWLDRLLPGVTQRYDPPQHLFVFSEAGIRTIMEQIGFEVVFVDRCFERSAMRRVIRIIRGFGLALGLRAVAALGRMDGREFCFTRFPIGNLISVRAKKP